MKRLLLLTAVAAITAAPLHARTWTNADGKSINAEFVRLEGDDQIVINMRGKDYTVPLAKFSEADQQWVAEYKQAQTEKLKGMVGRMDHKPIDTRLFPEWKEYYKTSDRRDVLTAFENGAWDDIKKSSPEQWMARDLEKDTCSIYVPPSYDGSEPYGLYLNIHSGDNAYIDRAWHPIFDEMKVIAVSVNGAGNNQAMLRRICLSIDAYTMIERDYKIDPERRVVGGGSGGGHMAFFTAAMFPDKFVGALSYAAQSYLPGNHLRMSSHFSGLTEKDFTRGKRKEIKWMVVSGDKDYNYQHILNTSKDWHRNRMQYQFMDIKGMGHSYPSVENFRKALEWVGM
ncbi:alpha/beta hydrolase-fold protein [Sulfuriroseicoccus oceanibius]|uniref:Esterase n=1 Tax=Sulfuriroseicoccus oceanibius TaxID=2707525 RepID=A0A6B3LC61_9BACT|nr:alpha/beta hydrolase-fold protein [Sulfuriroseicoccus oceanibius]QQL45492.1 hypothetical protein G3M56_002570 [Sulfuriroseicoccus oceanibius]